MTLIKSISGIRGTIGGRTGDTLNPLDIVKFTTAYAAFIRKTARTGSNRIVVGRDGRISGPMVSSIVCSTLAGMGFDVIDIGLASTPTTELAVTWNKADGGIIVTASHNPRQWNALKLLNSHGEFLSKAEGDEVLKIAESEDFEYADVDSLGQVYTQDGSARRHADDVLRLALVDKEAVRTAHFKVCADTINSVGAIALPPLFESLGVEYMLLNGIPDGQFAHNPEPLEQNLGGVMQEMSSGRYDLGIVVDPDVDRLAFITEDGRMFGEEYTLVAVADYVLSATPGGTVSNMSSSRALRDVAGKHGCAYAASAVGEVNVTTKMKETGAIIGGEGNGGVIYPECHYGRDALVGIALFLTMMAKRRQKPSEIRASLPTYFMAKNRIDLTPVTDIDGILASVKEQFKQYPVNTADGVKIDFPDSWVHLRRSNTEPIIRVYTEAPTQEQADDIGRKLCGIIGKMMG